MDDLIKKKMRDLLYSYGLRGRFLDQAVKDLDARIEKAALEITYKFLTEHKENAIREVEE